MLYKDITKAGTLGIECYERMWEVIPHADYMISLQAVWYGKCPRSLIEVIISCLTIFIIFHLEYVMEFGTSLSKLKIMRTAITYPPGIFESIMGWEYRFSVQIVPNFQAGSSTVIVQYGQLLQKYARIFFTSTILYWAPPRFISGLLPSEYSTNLKVYTFFWS